MAFVTVVTIEKLQIAFGDFEEYYVDVVFYFGDIFEAF